MNETQMQMGVAREETGEEFDALDILEFARAAIIDALFCEDGLTRGSGMAVVKMIDGHLVAGGREPQSLDEETYVSPLNPRDTARLDWLIKESSYTHHDTRRKMIQFIWDTKDFQVNARNAIDAAMRE